MLMALFVLLGFGLLFMFAFDEGAQGGDQSIESVISHQAKDIDGYQAIILSGKENLERAPARIANSTELTRLKRQNQALHEKSAELMKGIEIRKSEVGLKSEKFAGYKDQYRAYARGKAKGENIVKLQTLTGVVYDDVTIREVTAIGIQIRHSDGQKRIPFEELPEAMKDRFQFDPKQRDQALAEESAKRNEHEAAVAVTDAQLVEAKVGQRSADADEARSKTISAISYKEDRIQALEKEIESLKDAINLEERKPVSKAPGMRIKVVNNGRAIIELRSQIATLRSRL